jgi:long-chain acyl-CoA synthetase
MNPNTLLELFEQGVELHTNPKLLNYKGVDKKWHSISSEETQKKVRHIALGLSSLGIQKGDRVCILSEGRPEWTLCDLALLTLGGILVPLHVTQPPYQIEYILSDCDPEYIILSNRSLYDRVSPLLQKTDIKEKVIVFDSLPPIPHSKTLDEVEDAGIKKEKKNPELYQELRSRVKSEDLATIIYTYSDSGTPRGAMLTHKNLVSNTLSCSDLFLIKKGEDTALSYLPLSHVFERTIFFVYLYHQIQIYYAESLEKLLQNFKEIKPTLMTTVPRLLEKTEEGILKAAQKLPFLGKMLAQKMISYAEKFDPEISSSLTQKLKYKFSDLILFRNLRRSFGGRLKAVISGGAKLRPELARLFLASGILVLQGYGLTETSPVITVNLPQKNRIGSVGLPVPGVSVKIAEDGEILVQGPNVMKGYYKNEEATKTALDGGWFHTGDTGHLDPDGFLFITGRKKSLMKNSGGKYIAPLMIEKILKSNEYIKDAVVFGEGKKFVSALIFPNLLTLKNAPPLKSLAAENDAEFLKHPETQNFYDKIIQETNHRLSKWEAVKKFSLISEPLPTDQTVETLTPNEKRKKMEEKYRALIESFYD